MSSAELVETALSMKNVTFVEDDSWTTFEVIENGELGAGNRVQPVYFIYSYSVNKDGSDLQQHRPYLFSNFEFLCPDKDALKSFLERKWKHRLHQNTRGDF